MASTAVRVGRLANPSVPAGPRRFRPTLSTTPGRLRLLLVAGVLLSLAWGALAAFTANQYASAAVERGHHPRAAEPRRAADLLAAVRRERRRRAQRS